ncbi:unnamed protein product [Phytophthora lilii]|uniref:Unnamed protein product n=1 Tax=Phytophthora lilii TaxID=2077276 RepID=A0A9W6WNU6_9STRA|nr:unnamed protein product [Phytophthora lilii]
MHSKEAVAATDAVATAIMTPLLSSIDRINAALEAAVAQPPPPTGTLRVCHATEDEWNAFADSDGQIVRPKFFEWFADTEEIHIIEFADTPHEDYIAEFTQGTSFAEQNVRRWLKPHMAAKNSQGRRWCPDLSMGHVRQHQAPCFLQAFQYLQTFGRSKLKLESLSRGHGTRTTRPQGDIDMGCDARS